MTNGVPSWFTDMVKNSGLSSAPDANGHIHIKIDEIFKNKNRLEQAMNDVLCNIPTNIKVK